MNDDDDCARCIREAIQKHLGRATAMPAALRRCGRSAAATVPRAQRRCRSAFARTSFDRAADDTMCLIEPAVRCNHCGYCLSSATGMSVTREAAIRPSSPKLDRRRRSLEALRRRSLHGEPARSPARSCWQRVAGKDALVCLLTDTIDAAVLDAAGPQLKIVANVAVGYNNIDVPACRARGIVVTNTPDVLTNACADFTWALILAVTRRLGEGERELRARRVERLGARPHAGHGAARQAARPRRRRPHRPRRGRQGAGVRHDRGLHRPVRRRSRQTPRTMPLDRLLATSDVVSLHCAADAGDAGTSSTRRRWRKMKRSAYLINTSRGPVVDEAALAWALRERLIAGAALDVYEKEPVVHPDLLDARERAADSAPGQRHDRDAHGDGRPRGVERHRRARRPAASAVSQPVTVGRPCARRDCERQSGARRTRDAHAGARDRRPGAAGGREDLREAAGRSVPDPDRDAALGAHAGCHDAGRLDAAVRAGAHAADDGDADREADREADLSGELLSQQGAAREGRAPRCSSSGFGGQVPSTLEELVTLPGVGRKTANLVMILAFKSRQNICVDTHVHRISNRLGWVRTRQPEETEQALYRGHRPRWWPLSICIS